MNTLIIEERTSNTSGIPNVKRVAGLYECNVSKYNKIEYQSFERLDDAVNFWIDAKIELVEQLDCVREVKMKLLERYENLRKKYLYGENDLRDVENINPGKRTNAPKMIVTVGDSSVTHKGFSYEVVEVNGYKNITIRFPCGELRRVSNCQIKRGYIKYPKKPRNI